MIKQSKQNNMFNFKLCYFGTYFVSILVKNSTQILMLSLLENKVLIIYYFNFCGLIYLGYYNFQPIIC